MTVKRFDIGVGDWCKSDTGEVVKYSEYQKLERWSERVGIWLKKKSAECEDLKAALKQAKGE